MKTVATIGKIKLGIREKDHNPPHAHLIGPGIDIYVDLRTLETKSKDASPKMRRLAQAMVSKHLELCWTIWHETHGG